MNNMLQKNYLVVYYSHTGNTERIANLISKYLDCDIEKIEDMKKRSGPMGYVLAGRDGLLKKLTNIGNIKNDPSSYKTIIIGTPVWVSVTPAVRTYLSLYGNKIKNAAFFCTMEGSGGKKAFQDMEVVYGKKPISTLEIKLNEIDKDQFEEKIKEFIRRIKTLNNLYYSR